MSVKQSDIAKKLGVSRVTVTKALRDSSDISEDMKQKVRRAAKKWIIFQTLQLDT